MTSRLIASISLVLLLTMALSPLSTVGAIESPAVKVVPAQQTVQASGEIMSVEVRAENVTSLYGAELLLSFDPSVLQLVDDSGAATKSVIIGDLFDFPSKFVAANEIDSALGKVKFAMVLLGKVHGKSGSGVICSFHVKVLNPKQTTITLEATLVSTNNAAGTPFMVAPVVQGATLVVPVAQPPAGPPAVQPPAPPTQPTTPSNPGPDPGEAGEDALLNADELVISEATLDKDGTQVSAAFVSIPQATFEQAITKARQENQPVVISLPETPASSQLLRVDATQLPGLSDTGATIRSHNGTEIELPKEVIKALAEAGQSLELGLEPADEDAAKAALSAGDEFLQAHEIHAGIKGQTTLRFPAPPGVDPSGLRMRVLHSDGTEEDFVPEVIEAADGTFLKIVVSSFSTFILYVPSSTEPLQPEATKEIRLSLGNKNAAIDGKPFTLDAAPFVPRGTGRSLVPVRFVSEGLGADVEWLETTNQVRITDGDTVILLTLGSKRVLVNGQETLVDVAPVIKQARTFVPLRFVSETLQAAVDYIDATATIIIVR